MPLETTEIHSLLAQALHTINSKVASAHPIVPELPLTGTAGVLDSLDTMLFLDEVEDLLSKRVSFPIKLVTETVFARQPSPFLTVGSLTAYIDEVIKEAESIL